MWEQIILDIGSSISSFWQIISSWAGDHLFNIIIIIIVAELTFRALKKILGSIIRKVTRRPDMFPTELDRKKRAKTLSSLVGTVVRIIVLVITFIMVISELGLDASPLIASAGIIGVALGFGAQSLIRDLMSGFFIITENQFRVGDVIQAATSIARLRVTGTVEAITVRTTVIRDLDGYLHHITNGSIIVATNMTMDFAQINEEINLSLKTDIDKLSAIIDKVGQEMQTDKNLQDKIVQSPHFKRVNAITKDGIVIKIMGKTTPGDQWLVKGEMYRRLLQAFKKNNIKVAD